MKKINYFVGVLFAILAFAGFANSNYQVFADEEPEHHLGIAPTQSNFELMEPGQTYSGSFTVLNQGVGVSEFEIDYAPYAVKNETYEPVFDSTSGYTEISEWIDTSVDGGILQPGEKQQIDFTINVPTDVHGGSQSAVIVVRLKTNDEITGTSVNTVQQLGYLVFGNVDGDIVETGKILENKVPSFLFNPPILGSSVVENTGNVYTRAKYKLQVFPLFSDEEVYTNEEDPEKSIIFPETKRYNEVKWEGAPHLGIFKVRQTVEIFDESSVTEKLVFLCPIWFLFIVLLLIFCIIFWIFSRIFKRKRES